MSVPTNHASDSNSSQFSPGALSELSRNTSAISTSSSDSTSSRLLTLTPRPRPLRTFSAPRSQSPQSGSPRRNNHPHYLSTELGYSDTTQNKTRSKSRGRNVAATVEDFKFGPTLGEGSYSTARFLIHFSLCFYLSRYLGKASNTYPVWAAIRYKSSRKEPSYTEG